MAVRRKDGTWNVAKLPSGDWHPEEIKAAVRMARPRMTLHKLCHDSGIHPHAAHHAIARPHYPGEQAIAAILGLTPQDIWPSRHEADGTRICRVRTRGKVSAEPTFRLRENPRSA